MKHLVVAAALAAPAALAEELKPSDVLVSRGEVSVTVADLDAVASTLPEDVRGGVLMDPVRLEQFINNVLTTRAVARHARESGLDQDPLVQAQMASAIEEVLARNAIDRQLKQQVPDWDALAREQYLVNKAQFRTGETRTLAHVLIGIEKRSDAEALALAEDVYEKALNGIDFAELARSFSEDPGSAANGGVYEKVARGRMVKPFEDAAFALASPGDITEPVKTQFGYHVIRLVEIQPPRQRSYEEVAPGIIERISKDWKVTATADFLDQFRSVPLDVNAEAMAVIRERYAPTTN